MLGNFTIADIARTLAVFLIYPFFTLLPGFLVAQITGVFGFRRTTLVKQLGIALVIAVTAFPIFTYLIARATGIVWTIRFYALIDVVSFLVIVINYQLPAGDNRKSLLRGVAYATCLILLCLALMMDYQVNNHLFLSVLYGDYEHHTALTDTIVRQGTLPPINPYFIPGHFVSLCYYYFFVLQASLVSYIMQGPLDSRAACYAGAIWSLITSFFTLDLFCRYKESDSAIGERRLDTVLAIGLCFVSGLQGPVIAFLNYQALRLNHMLHYGSISWFTFEQNFSCWFVTSIWVPQHINGTLCGLVALLLCQRAFEPDVSVKERWSSLTIAACACASMCGYSVYLAIAFFVYFAALAFRFLFQHNWRCVTQLMFVGALAILLSIPFLVDTAYANHFGRPAAEIRLLNIPAVSEPLFGLLHRTFNMLPDFFLQQVCQVISIPLYYFFSLGVFVLGGILYWFKRSAHSTQDRMLLGLLLVSLLLSITVRTVIGNNDLGWRVKLPAEFILIIWTARVISQAWRKNLFVSFPIKALFNCCLVIGLASTLYEFYLARAYPLRPLDSSVSYGARIVCEQLNRSTPAWTIVQYNPHAWLPYTAIYAHRPVVAFDQRLGYHFGNSRDDYMKVENEVAPLFQNANEAQLRTICDRYHIEWLLVQPGDPITKIKGNETWLANHKPTWECQGYKAYSVK